MVSTNHLFCWSYEKSHSRLIIRVTFSRDESNNPTLLRSEIALWAITSSFYIANALVKAPTPTRFDTVLVQQATVYLAFHHQYPPLKHHVLSIDYKHQDTCFYQSIPIIVQESPSVSTNPFVRQSHFPDTKFFNDRLHYLALSRFDQALSSDIPNVWLCRNTTERGRLFRSSPDPTRHDSVSSWSGDADQCGCPCSWEMSS